MNARRYGIAGYALLTALTARALDPRTGGLTLLETADARATALGEAGTALTGDASGVAYNPAVLTTLKGAQFLTQFQSAPGDVRTGLLGFAQSGDRWGWGLSAVYFDAGDVTINPSAGTSQTLNAQQDFAGTLSGGVAVSQGFRLGATVKGLSSTLAEEYSATAFAADAGLLADLPAGFRLGASVQNVGQEITYRSVGDPLPMFYRLGLSFAGATGEEEVSLGDSAPWYMKQRAGRNSFWAGADAILDRWGAVVGALGFEWDYNHQAVFRAGGRLGGEETGLTGGFGFYIKSWRMDYSIQLIDDLKDRHRITVSYFWTSDSGS